MSSVKKQGFLFFKATSPKRLLEREQNHLESQHHSLTALGKVLPDLAHLHADFNTTPQMSVYKGKEGLIQVMEDTLTTKGELLCWANPEVVHLALEDYYPEYIKKKVERNIWLRSSDYFMR